MICVLKRVMSKFIIVAILTMAPALAQTGAPSEPPLTDREQVKADRARAAEDEKAAPIARPWDRDADGKRPWERKSAKP